MMIYVYVCLLLTFMMYFKIYAECVEFKKRHPDAKFKKVGWQKTVCNFLKVIIMMLVPFLNVGLFWMIFCYYETHDYEHIIWQSCESTLD